MIEGMNQAQAAGEKSDQKMIYKFLLMIKESGSLEERRRLMELIPVKKLKKETGYIIM